MNRTAPTPWRDVRAGVAAVVAVLLLLVAVPLGLWALAGWPLPTSVPSWSSITDALRTSHVPDTVLAKGLALVCWLVWLELVASVIVEAVALIRGRQAADVPLAGPLQKMAGRLVVAIALLAVLSAARSEAPQEGPRPLLLPGAPVVLDLAASEPTAAAVEQGLPTYTVQHRDTLWDIAERHLDDPFRWNEIWELNRDRPQVDGTTFSDPDRICPGWELTLPADAVGVGGAPAVEATSVELLVRVDDDAPDMVLATDTDQELLVPLDVPEPADHAG